VSDGSAIVAGVDDILGDTPSSKVDGRPLHEALR
jgi:hypothetical protein